ncbi:MAG: glycosyltransferase family 4 protein [candidate division Zixibacteria bacterium]|nr:glycosyltransferase family 4 protein [candidate division Zixibacteria bacterium]
MERKLRILTYIKTQASPTWKESVTLLQTKPGFINSFIAALQLYYKKNDYDLVVISGEKPGIFFSLLQAILPLRKTPSLMIGSLFYRAKNPLRRYLKRVQLKLMCKSVRFFLVWAKREIKDYSVEFDIPVENFKFFPYHTTCEVYDCPVRKGDYIFSGGNRDRDFKTLIEAVMDLGVRTIIATNNRSLLRGIKLPENVEIISATDPQFYQLLAGSRLLVLPMSKGFLHSGGQQTFLNAMYWGKPVIVADPEGAKDYIENGTTGILVNPGRPAALREAILSLLENPEKSERMGQEAKKKARELTTEKFFQGILKLAEEIVYEHNRI